MSKPIPKLRVVDYQPNTHEGEQVWFVEDPLQLSDKMLILPPILAQATLYFDGWHTIEQVQGGLEAQVGVPIPIELLENLVQGVDELFLFQNERMEQRLAEIKQVWRAQEARPPLLANRNYPAEPEALAEFLEGYISAATIRQNGADWANWHGRAIVSPHIDYHRGGAVYAQLWQRAEKAVQTADLVLIFATDHRGGLGSLTLSSLPYATPYGVLPTDEGLVQTLADCLGHEVAYGLELNHRLEHSVELVAVWLHHALRGQAPPPVVPLLIGSFQHFVAQGGHPTQDEEMMAFIETLIEATEGKRVLCVASADLAHVGPAFDDEFVMDETRRTALASADASLMEAVLARDAERFYREIAAVEDAHNVCGFSPIYLMLRYLNGRETAAKPLRGHQIAYQQCPADMAGHSLVSICGLLLE